MTSRSTLRAMVWSSRATSIVTMRAVAALGEAIDEAVADFAAGAGDEDNWFAHARIILNGCEAVDGDALHRCRRSVRRRARTKRTGSIGRRPIASCSVASRSASASSVAARSSGSSICMRGELGEKGACPLSQNTVVTIDARIARAVAARQIDRADEVIHRARASADRATCRRDSRRRSRRRAPRCRRPA